MNRRLSRLAALATLLAVIVVFVGGALIQLAVSRADPYGWLGNPHYSVLPDLQSTNRDAQIRGFVYLIYHSTITDDSVALALIDIVLADHLPDDMSREQFIRLVDRNKGLFEPLLVDRISDYFAINAPCGRATIGEIALLRGLVVCSSDYNVLLLARQEGVCDISRDVDQAAAGKPIADYLMEIASSRGVATRGGR